MDKIIISGLKFPVSIGLTEKERKTKQRIIFDVSLFSNLEKAGASDKVEDTINYSDVCQEVKKIASQEYKTLEALAHQVASKIKTLFQVEVTVLVVKPGALKRFSAKYAAVEVTR